MLIVKVQTSFTNSVSRSSSSVLRNSLLFPDPPFYNALLIRNLRCSAQAFQIKRSALVSRTCTRFCHATGHFSYAFDEIPHRKTYTLLRDVFKIVQSVCNMEPNPTDASMVHALALKNGALSDLTTATSLLTVYSRAKEFGSAVALFGEALDKDVVFWNAMVTVCVKNKRFETVLDFFNRMVSEGNTFDHTTLVIVVSAFSNLKILRQCHVIHGLSIKAGMLADVVLSNAMIDMYAKCGDLTSSEFIFARLESKDLITWNSIIIGCFYNNSPEKSLLYFSHMIACETEVDGVSISCAMAACTCLQEYDVGVAAHGLGIKLGYAGSSHISVDNSLISFYSQFRDIDSAEYVFKGIMDKNVVSWNAMIKGFLLNAEVVKAFYLLRDMQFVESIQPDMATVVSIVPYCAEFMLLREGKAAHGFSIRREMVSELSVINSLINMYANCNHLKEAECLFLNMPNKDLVAWNTMISGYAQNGRCCDAQMLFKKLTGFCSSCTLPTLLAVNRSCDSPDSLQFGRSIHAWHIKLGFSDQIFAVNSLIQMYISCGALPDGLALFGRISIWADVSGWNTVIAGCTRTGHFLEALEYFNIMRKAVQVHWNSITLVSVISACGNLGLALQGKLIHGLALKTRVGTDLRVHNSLVTMYGRLGDTESAKSAFNHSYDHNLCSWNCIISALSQNEDAKKAVELFCSLDFEPNVITISTILSASTQLGAINYGKQIHGHVFRFHFHQNPFVSSALLDMYSNCGRLDIAEKVFLSSPKKSVTAWNSLISAYGFHNFGAKAIETFQNMIKTGIRPTNSTFTSLLSACSHSGLVDEGRIYYEHMLGKFQVQPAIEHHVCMVDMLGRSGQLCEAYDFVKGLPTEPETGIWGALLSACSYNSDIDMGRKVAEILFSLEPEHVSYYVCLCNMYIGAGRWEEAVELRNVIQDKEQKKTPGYSLINVISS